MPSPDSTTTTTSLSDCLRRIERGRTMQRMLLMQSNDIPVEGYDRGLIDAVELFESLGIRYALVGGIAAMVYGRARFTEDVDFVASDGHMAVLEDNAATMKQHHFDPTCTWKLYHDSGLAIDLWKDEYADAIIDRAREVELAGRTIRIADPHDLIAMKLRADRPQDDYDISEIIKRGGIDDDRVRELVTKEQHERFVAIRRRIEAR